MKEHVRFVLLVGVVAAIVVAVFLKVNGDGGEDRRVSQEARSSVPTPPLSEESVERSVQARIRAVPAQPSRRIRIGARITPETPNLSGARLQINPPKGVLAGERARLSSDRRQGVRRPDGLPLGGGIVSGRTYDVNTGNSIADVSIEGYGGGARRTTKTDAEGNYRLGGLVEGTCTIRRSPHEGYHHGKHQEKEVQVHVGEEISGVDFPMKLGIVVHGRVVDAEDQPVEGVLIKAFSRRFMDEKCEDVTDEEGRFECQGFSANNEVYVRAEKKGYALARLGPIAVDEQNSPDIDLVLEVGASISGIVVDVGGRPVERVNVWAKTQGDGGFLYGRESTKQDGLFNVDCLNPGTYTFTLGKGRRRVRPEQTFAVRKGEKISGVRLVLEPESGPTISGRVTDVKGQPVAGAGVTAWAVEGSVSGGTGEDGRYEVRGLKPGVYYNLDAHHTAYRRSGRIKAEAGSRGIDIVLEKNSSVAGRVWDASTGRPLTQFEVGYVPGVREWDTHLAVDFTHQREPNGRYRLDQIQEPTITVVARAVGYVPAVQVVADLEQGQAATDIDLRLYKGGVVEGVILDEAGAPVADAHVTFGQEEEPSLWSQNYFWSKKGTLADGKFRLEGVCTTQTSIQVHHKKYLVAEAGIAPKPGRTQRVEIRLDRGGIVQGAVRVGGHAAPNCSVSLYSVKGGRYSKGAKTDASGAYTISGLPSGTMILRVVQRDADGGNPIEIKHPGIVEVGGVTYVDFDF